LKSAKPIPLFKLSIVCLTPSTIRVLPPLVSNVIPALVFSVSYSTYINGFKAFNTSLSVDLLVNVFKASLIPLNVTSSTVLAYTGIGYHLPDVSLTN